MSRLISILSALRRHPLIASVFVVCIVAGAIGGPLVLPDSLSDVRRVLGGAVAGFGVALLSIFPRMLD